MSTPEVRRRAARRGYAYIVLVLICVGAAIIAVLWSASIANRVAGQDQQTRHELCGVLAPFANTPAPQTATVAYQYHLKFVTLSRQFGC